MVANPYLIGINIPGFTRDFSDPAGTYSVHNVIVETIEDKVKVQCLLILRGYVFPKRAILTTLWRQGDSSTP